jgi:hypothetical protein
MGSEDPRLKWAKPVFGAGLGGLGLDLLVTPGNL